MFLVTDVVVGDNVGMQGFSDPQRELLDADSVTGHLLPAGSVFGFRPRRATHDALQVLVDESWRGRRWVVETDIANCLDAWCGLSQFSWLR